MTPLLRGALLLSIAATLFGFTGCGGSSKGGGGESAASTGSVSVFITDAPSDAFDKILIDVEGIELIGGGPKVTLFSGNETIDLKDLEDFSDLFVHAEDVPARTYSKIRLHVGRIQLVRVGDDAEVVEVRLPANGKIDLIPDEHFRVVKGADTVIELDMDARNSIHIVGNGNGQYRFRPVVHIQINDTVAPRKLTRAHGTIRAVFDDENFVLCQTMFMASRDVMESREDEESGGLGDRRRCMTVEVNDLTGVFDEDGDPLASSELAAGDKVTVVGRMHVVDVRHDENEEVYTLATGTSDEAPSSMLESTFEHRRHRHMVDGDEDERVDRDRRRPVRLVLLAYVVEAGPPNTFLRLRGEIDSEVDSDDRFLYAVAPGQGFGSGSRVSALLQDGTRIFTRGGIEVDDSEVVPGTEAKIDGILNVGSTSSNFKTALLVLNIELGEPQAVRGKIFEIDSTLRRIFLEMDTIENDEIRRACVDADDDTRIVIIRETDEFIRNSSGSFDELEVGFRLHAFGRAGEQGCLEAKSIIAFPPPPVPNVCRNNAGCGDTEFCSKDVGSCDDAGICETVPRICTRIYDPVCGCDGETYGNRCEANSAGVSVEHEGRCVEDEIVCGGFIGAACPDGTICRYPDDRCQVADDQGICVETSEICPSIGDPVCGCNGVTYRNRCEVTNAHVRVLHEGRCESPNRCGGIAGERCDEGEICVFEDGVCISDAQGMCEPGFDACPEVYQPVCGCDGVTYSNTCFAKLAQIAIAHRGACETDDDCRHSPTTGTAEECE